MTTAPNASDAKTGQVTFDDLDALARKAMAAGERLTLLAANSWGRRYHSGHTEAVAAFSELKKITELWRAQAAGGAR